MRKGIDWLKSRFETVYEKRVSPVPLGFFRIIYGISVFIEVINLIYFKQLFFDPIPFIESHPYPIVLILVFWAVSVLLITVGYKVKASAAFNFIFCVAFLGFGASFFAYEWHADSLIITGALLLLFMPTDRALSVKMLLKRKSGSLESKPTIRYIYPVLLMLLIGGIYFDSIFWKTTSNMYLNGLGLWAPASLPFNVYWDLQWFIDFEYLMYASSFIVLFYEAAFIFLVWFRFWRILFVTLGVLFHIAIGIAFPLPAFGLIMVGFLLGCMPTGVYARIYTFLSGKKFKVHHPTDELEGKGLEKSGNREYFGNGLITQALQKKVLAAYLCFWFISLVIIHFRSPFYLTYLGDKESIWSTAYKVGAVYKSEVYPLTGFSTHGLYVDNHFQNYVYQIRLSYVDNGKEISIPVIRDNGMAGIYNVGRNHIYWTFRTASPNLSPDLMQKRIKRFILFWAGKNDIDIGDAVFNIYTKPLRVSVTNFSQERLHHNMSSKWQLSGKFFAREGNFKYKWIREFRKGLALN